MKNTLILIFTIFTLALSAQSDTLDSKITTNYDYTLHNGKHYYVITTIHADSSETIQRIPFARKRDVVDYAKYQAAIADSLVNVVNEQINQKLENIKNLEDQIIQYNKVLSEEFQKYRQELRALRTQRKLIAESKQKNNNVR